MILEIKTWCEGIIVAIIICLIIESLIPEGNNKKYIKVVIGIYIMYVSLNPILNLLEYDFDFKNMLGMQTKTVEVYSVPETSIKDVYIMGIEQNIREEVKNLGYEVEKIKVFVDLEYENIEKIEMEIKSSDNMNFNKILEAVSKNYSVNLENIIIK